jgi:hypothetical protein
MRIDAVILVGAKQFFGANQAERIEELRADGVVARFAAGQRQQQTRAPSPRLSIASSPPCSSSGCAVVGITLAMVRS